jgi:hypothetical protein
MPSLLLAAAQEHASLSSQLAPVGTLTAALVAAAVALYLNARGRKNAERDRRRTLYSEAYRVALEWCEGIYRVRRRPQDGSGDTDLVRHFHEMQERIAYYEGWLAMESPQLGRAYKRFLREVMDEARPLIQDAWSHLGCPPTGQTNPDDQAPALNEAKGRFLLDVREHLSRWFWVRGRLRKRERKEARARKHESQQPKEQGS